MKRMTQSDNETLIAIDHLAFRKGLYPTFTEIGEEIGVTARNALQKRVGRLEARGMLRRMPHRARAMEITIEGRRHLDSLHRQPVDFGDEGSIEMTEEGELAANAFRTLGDVALDNLRHLERCYGRR